jgi:membrane protein
VERLFDLFVIDRAELAYQLNLDSTHVDSAMLLAALDNDALKVNLSTLLAARAVSRGAAQQDQAGPDAAAALPQQTA